MTDSMSRFLRCIQLQKNEKEKQKGITQEEIFHFCAFGYFFFFFIYLFTLIFTNTNAWQFD